MNVVESVRQPSPPSHSESRTLADLNGIGETAERGQPAQAGEEARLRIARARDVGEAEAQLAEAAARDDLVDVPVQRGIGDYLHPRALRAEAGQTQRGGDVDVGGEQSHGLG